jgi:hypothetical protein
MTRGPRLRRARTTDEGGRGLFLVALLAQHWVAGTRRTARSSALSSSCRREVGGTAFEVRNDVRGATRNSGHGRRNAPVDSVVDADFRSCLAS